MSKPSLNFPTLLWIASTLLILASIIAGLVVTGGPGYQRQLRLDKKRTQRLETLYLRINTYYHSENRIPDTLEQLATHSSMEGWTLNTTDPITGKPFTYRPLDETTYQLCAHFELASPEEGSTETYPHKRPWTHPAGSHCFRLEAQATAPNKVHVRHR